MEKLILVFIVTFLVRIVGVITGGGGMVLIPFLVFLGLPPSEALATNRFGALGVNCSLLEFHRQKQVQWKLGLSLLIPTILGSVIGSFFVVSIDQQLFQKLLGIVILLCIPLLLFQKDIGTQAKKISRPRFWTGIFLTLVAGFMGGLFASTGIWYSYLFFFFGLTMLQTAATRKIIGFAVALSSLFIFIPAGLIDWTLGITMLIASLLGGILGAKIGIKKGNVWAKNVFLFVVFLAALKMILG
ncbi:sulfite exporter TauE/SafE family protein [Candidatus Gracilibacteria bacterium]|nr:sulfite exporter TauE/SafE family protein [Candidatus Gracilibacteria bacterium]MCF7819067.1 sulfite exporter TauE/SafE family protein [Candidatus Gracilibacteria bacterium]